jgi:cation diffusion facilitator CzcD-associated flavoprotein CzcO
LTSFSDVKVVVIGAGFAGIAAAHRLVGAGVDDVIVLERGTRIGGVWRDNEYPGCTCDIPSNLYS